MKSVFELIKQEEFTKKDLDDIASLCKSENSLAPLYAVIHISSEQEIHESDKESLIKLIRKYPDLFE